MGDGEGGAGCARPEGCWQVLRGERRGQAGGRGARAAQGQLMSSSCTAGRFEFKRGAHGEPGGSGGHVGSEADGARSRLARDADARGELG